MSRDPKYHSPEFAALANMPPISGYLEPAEPCNECNRDVDPDDAGPSCGAHVLHIECGPWFHCRECWLVQAEVCS